ncbi:DNA cytosine methyltransferase [Salinibacterium sp. ZJ450]|uniref:DNA cytosine methyltransferase n=1 Tax=Salinibacterium sp. ZJ450 TaxID=2708338 RepID=UPI001420D0F3|nr:DNA cytosine methyltransferase [Salinibacterium sp. ZJ450]
MKYVDLFAGCGGLSLGVERAGFELALAVEKSDMAARTYFHNFIGDAADPIEWERYVNGSVEDQVEQRVLVRELAALLNNEDLLQRVSEEGIDLVVGGPPCQGFSLAGRRNPDDVRNKLPWEYLRFVEAAKPKAVVIENVVGMKQRFANDSESSFEQLQQALRETEPGYVVQAVEVNAMHYGAPQHRPRLMIIGLRSDIATAAGIEATSTVWRSDFLDNLDVRDIPSLAPVPTRTRANVRTVGEAIADLANRKPRPAADRSREYVAELRDPRWALQREAPSQPQNDVRRKHVERTTERFRLYQYLHGQKVDARLLNRIAALEPVQARETVVKAITGLKYPAVAPDKTVLARNEDELTDLCLRLATKKHSQKVLDWDSPARTVVTIPDDYVHPVEPRLFTVRELARFQGFPDSFEFLGKETTGAHRRKVEVPQYSQVGNAVSPWLALAVGTRISEVLGIQATESLAS